MSVGGVLSWLATAPFPIMLLLKVTAILGMSGIAARCLRNAAPGVRHYLWTMGLCGALVLPMAMALAPAWHVRVLPSPAAAIPAAAAGAPLGPVPAEGDHAMPPARVQPNSTHGIQKLGTPVTPHPHTWWLLLLWLAGSCLYLGRIAIGWRRLRRLQRSALPLDSSEWREALARERAHAAVQRPVRLYSSPTVTTPLTWGTRRPIIVVPAHMAHCSPEERVVVLRHELAHVVRNDSLAQCLTSLTCALYWAHPLVWVAARRQHAECERACDAQVLSSGTSAIAYAAQLVRVARATYALGAYEQMALPMARPSQLEERLLAILYPRGRHAPLSGRARAGGAAALCVTVLAVSAFRLAPRARTDAHRAAPVTRSGHQQRVATRARAVPAIGDSTAVVMHPAPVRGDTHHAFLDSTGARTLQRMVYGTLGKQLDTLDRRLRSGPMNADSVNAIIRRILRQIDASDVRQLKGPLDDRTTLEYTDRRSKDGSVRVRSFSLRRQ